MSIDYSKQFITTDMGLATALLTADFKLIDLDKTDRTRMKFVFERKKGIEKIMEEYLSGELELPLLSFFNNLRSLKNRIYSDDA